ncbi:sulfotransferase family protein [Salix suchowensis]|nr:sulfotransferase family protein [Salix suchowensis]
MQLPSSYLKSSTMPASSTAATTSMVLNNFTKNQANDNGEDLEKLTSECKELLLSLPREKGWRTACLYKYKGFWCQSKEIEAIISFEKHFQPRDTDVILASIPKSGTTWLKALSFAIVNRKKFAISSDGHPLLASNPHDLVPFFEYKLYAEKQVPDLSKLPDPRLFATHIPFDALQDSVKNSGCRIIYICEIQGWLLLARLAIQGYSQAVRVAHPSQYRHLPQYMLSELGYTIPGKLDEEHFESFFKGQVALGPFWDHVFGYWKESLEKPHKTSFFMYEDLKGDIVSNLKRLAEFIGYPFSAEEEKRGVIQEIADLCSLKSLKDLEVNKSGSYGGKYANNSFFRKGEVGDWANYLSSTMMQRLEKLMQEKLSGSGLIFKMS